MTTSDWAGSYENTPEQERREQGLLEENRQLRQRIKELEAVIKEIASILSGPVTGEDADVVKDYLFNQHRDLLEGE